MLKAWLGEIPVIQAPTALDPGSSVHLPGSTGCRTSSPYVSAAVNGFDTSSEPQRMSLGSSGASLIQAIAQIQREGRPQPRSKMQPAASRDNWQAGVFLPRRHEPLLEEQEALSQIQTPAEIQNPGSQDVEMESTKSQDPDHSDREYDPDELDFPTPTRAAVATTTAGSTGSTLIQRVRISAISDRKEFSGKDPDEDRARAWVDKVKSAFLRDQASDKEKCLTFADLLSGSARNWYHQLPRSIQLLRALDRAKNRQKKSAAGFSKYRQEAPANPAPAVPTKHVRAVQIQASDPGSDSSSDGSDSDGDEYRRIYLAGNGVPLPRTGEEPRTLDPSKPERRPLDQAPRDPRSRIQADGSDRSRCSHCGSRKHTER
ncbi:hypothetical protein ON010_g9789 [Phytophthora cinnamomi]|nr:hypothetical protein ON010_g9789 [Phytophthora cinnamomi]